MCYKVDTIFFSLFFYFTISSHIYTYKDHSLQSVVHRPYSGLTPSLIPFTTYIYTFGLPRSHKVNTASSSLGLGLDSRTAMSIFSYF